MPTEPYSHADRVGRFREQRWLLDAVIRVIGPEFDQARLHYLSATMTSDHMGAVMGLATQIKRWDDIAPEFAKCARRFELNARVALDHGHEVTASDGFFAASVMYGGAQWPIFSNSELNIALEAKKTECYLAYAEHADHRIEVVEIPYRGKSLASYLHFPPSYVGGKLPCLVMASGMDGFKEFSLSGSADRFLRRGFACLCIDVPGQGTSLIREIWYEPELFGEVGPAAFDYLVGREEIDPKRIMAWGISFGSYWATQMAAAEPRFAACAVLYNCFHPHNWPMYAMAAPSFKQRFMYMVGVESEEAFESIAQKMDVRELSSKITMPYLVMAGEDDALSDVAFTFEHLNAVPGLKTFYLYAGEEHGIGGSRSAQLSAPYFSINADWLKDRADGKSLESSYNLVDRTGQTHSEAWGAERSYQYGAPLGVEQLLSGKPPIGLS